ncbi:hypothetical protein CKO25_17465 [Thiocapsa imhoffii]|uniref:Uncharacterized protein n=1 Tax=Thiocapsa imhoffii TaxID=382777 RepID=A0A9X1BB56_9GAMM|nr:hypothetical protein [Thiocapsa imhoffii]MBK1646401.1 hypothetical protein [Thiocapsa imhoffii]
MTAQPLTHHEIMTLVEPFTRRGRHVDLAASERMERRLAFKPIEHAAPHPSAPILRDTLLLEQPREDRYRLTRSLAHPSGLVATLVGEGSTPEVLLTKIEAIDPHRQFRAQSNWVIARSYRLEAASGAPIDAATPTRLIMLQGAAQVDGLTLTMKVQTGRGMPADLHLDAAEGDEIVLPEDMLAVIGWDWRRLARMKQGWRSTVRLRGNEPDRSRDAEVKLTRTVEHLAETLAQPPSRYHERLTLARWNVVFRRAIPLLIGVGLILGAPAVQFLELSDDSLIRMLIFHSPPLLMILFFSMREMPRIEIPPFPKPLAAEAWRAPKHPLGGTAPHLGASGTETVS